MNMDMLRALTLEMYFDFLGVHLNGPKAQGEKLLISFTFLQTDPSEPSQFVFRLENSVLTYTIGRTDETAKLHITLTRPVFLAIFFGNIKLQELIDNKQVQAAGDIDQVNTLLSLFDEFSTGFPIVTPFGPHQNGAAPHL
jgi:alkyl sulfatase BDS1-like metallo-beta-lactamase superfamily hydrolase